jgi:hypothetical protein
VAGILPVNCETCGDDGYVWLSCVRYSSAHEPRKGATARRAVVARRERFRCPCDCERGAEWIEARRSGEELTDADDD